ncbi:MAG: hypothetical protein JWM57_4320 [Phycisphaerales bacterium]|nr:hypothetical protein [Phycisphaerales bacterium]
MADLVYQLTLLKIPVSDITRSAAFYAETLKWEPQFVADEYGWAQFDAGGLPVALYKPGMGGGDGKPGGSTGFHLAVPADAFSALAADLLSKGVLVDNRVQQGDDGTTYVQLCDPDGNVLNIGRIASETAEA